MAGPQEHMRVVSQNRVVVGKQLLKLRQTNQSRDREMASGGGDSGLNKPQPDMQAGGSLRTSCRPLPQLSAECLARSDEQDQSRAKPEIEAMEVSL